MHLVSRAFVISLSVVCALSALSYAYASEQKLNYPESKQGDVSDIYFGTKIADPFRWLEDDRSKETGIWVKAQNQLTQSYLKKIPYRDKLATQLRERINYAKVSSPFKEGKYTYYYKNDGLQNHSVLYRQQGKQKAEVFLDPNTFSEDATTSLSDIAFSHDGKLAAYAISEGGSDWRKIIVIDTETMKVLGDPIVNVKFSGLSWFKNEGFYYSSYDKPKNSQLSEKTDQHKLYYHKIGTPQSADSLIFGGTQEEKRRYVGGYVTEDNRYLMVTGANSTSGNDLRIKDLSKPENPLIIVQADMNSDSWVINNDGQRLFIYTNLDAPNKKLVEVNATAPSTKNWKDLIPEQDNVLSVSTGGGSLFAEYMIDATSKIFQYNYDGKLQREIELPGLGSASTLSGKRDQAELYYSFSNYITPKTIFTLNAKSGKSKVYRKSGAVFDSKQYVSKQVFYLSSDGTKVPMTITHKKGLKLGAKTPTILYGYGGFDISLTPNFKMTTAAWLENNGVYAVANLRGGGEYGKAWHDAGRLMNKQNVFDDFIAAAEYLIKNNITSADYLAASGRSNGGLLVAAAMTQRPDLFRVALPQVGVLDMLRYHTFTSGAGWAHDYGTSEQSKEMFDYLNNYSPLHNVKSGVNYPSTMITTADHDDRVVPAHSFKFAAELQTKHSGNKPTVIRIDTKAGHGAGMSINKVVEFYADLYAFTYFEMGIEDPLK